MQEAIGLVFFIGIVYLIYRLNSESKSAIKIKEFFLEKFKRK
jgi:hypothetical protein